MSDLGREEREALKRIVDKEAGDDPTPNQAALKKDTYKFIADVDGPEEDEEE